MNELDQKLLAIIQDSFPLAERPYKVLAEMLNCDGEKCANSVVSEQDVFEAVETLRASGVIRRIGGVYDSKKLGFISRLCAGKIAVSPLDFSAEPHEQTAMEKFAAAVMSEPAITHNYIRSHEYNVWWTVIAQNENEIQSVVDKLCASTDLHDVHVLSATKKYKINTVMGANAPVDSDCRKSDGEFEDSRNACLSKRSKNVIASEARQSPAGALTDVDRIRIRIACDDIPHSLTPFKDWGVSCDELREDLASKRMRRFGAILRHQEAGFAFNAMVCFRLVGSRKSAVGSGCSGEIGREVNQKSAEFRHSDNQSLEESSKILALAQKHYVSHCYERPSFENFPYNLYAMMHAQTSAELDSYIKDAASLLETTEYVVLHSVKELKKTSFKFFA